MVKGDCKLESFSTLLKNEVVKAFVKTAFHITYENVSNESITYTNSEQVHAKVSQK